MSEPQYFHIYATANDTWHYYRDIQNLIRIYKMPSGVSRVNLYMAISKVKPVNFIDKTFVRLVRYLFNNHKNIALNQVLYKSNIGRDFSSYNVMLNIIKQQANLNDYVFFQNRSGFGPFKENWLTDFKSQFLKFPNTALCGSTINFIDHPLRSDRNNLPHVQTYAFLSSIKYLNLLGESFPGINETSRLNIIFNGEIELSNKFLNLGYGLTCMEWPDQYITRTTPALSDRDVRGIVKQQHQFYHKGYILLNERKTFRNWHYLKTLFLFILTSLSCGIFRLPTISKK
ncbi:hypothetical protein FJ651_06805 [Paucihalobacter ruber]|uniref:Uncharacterized protein n=1 Tax=Paucihalobacter ruber TaxID=2567861 RepID=A0A506PJ67_9FLAO|nr:hypothetical protein [Paucihalobacter ruber]TPV33863.1 hypothetical protein FJ651_06805 [Paucihalobacter ruber]